jgi:small-conductance mechanosensitive channel
VPRPVMTEKKKEDEKKSAKLPPFVEPQLFVTVEEANRRLKEIMKVTDPTTGLYKSIQRITEVSDMMLRRQDQLRKLYEPSENVRKYLERIRQLVEQITRAKMNELPAASRTIIPQLEGEVSGYVETFEHALAEKEKEIETLKAELEALKSKTTE